ncbi:hypothetical protein POF50_032715 [Streptomyces sp. SL13]|uniref:Uncharacterized protein n=1 Tax=Streptantibioticus silvisoli TaxID=2705255 RepID=A0AA90KK25_9ACTN|nr:hypothetical protein [Streptantibioticus silvisoli]MDI5974054.1 hypothetical protein [Streptantibioticus silvisoli]
MLTPPAFASFDQAYAAVLQHVNDRHEYANFPRGNDSRECIGVNFQLTDPRGRTPFNPVYHFAEALWYLGGRRDLDMIAHYAPRRHADLPRGHHDRRLRLRFPDLRPRRRLASAVTR